MKASTPSAWVLLSCLLASHSVSVVGGVLRVIQADTTDGGEAPGNNEMTSPLEQANEGGGDSASATRLASCDLNCQNEGICEELVMAEEHANTMPKRCVCPTGYGGILCEIETDLCFSVKGKDQYCQNGAPCVLETSSDDRRVLSHTTDRIMCDCKQAYGISAFAGIDCSFPATEYCTETSSMSYTAFCTNGGACTGYATNPTDSHPGCECTSGFEGPHCEFVKGTMKSFMAASSSGYSATAHKAFTIVLAVLFSGSLILLAELVRRWRVRTLAEREIVRQANFVTAELTLRCMKQLSNDGGRNSGSGGGRGSNDMTEAYS